MTTGPKHLTAEELEWAPASDRRQELVGGNLVVITPAGFAHGRVAGKIFAALHTFVHANQLGETCAAETGFVLARNPDTVRAPDAAFVTASRAALQVRKEGYFDGAPDLAVEVVSPNDTDEDLHQKVLDYLRAGSRQVWVVRPRSRTVSVFRSFSDVSVLGEGDAIVGHDLLPGFSLPVEQIFQER